MGTASSTCGAKENLMWSNLLGGDRNHQDIWNRMVDFFFEASDLRLRIKL